MAFLRWLDDRPTKSLPTHELLIQVSDLARAKALFDAPNPADWPADVIDELFEVLAEQPHLDPKDFARRGVPALTVFFDFLVQTGRWKPNNDEQASQAALERARRAALAGSDPSGTATTLPPQWASRFERSDAFGGQDDVADDDDFDDDFDDDEEGDFDDFEERAFDPEVLERAALPFAGAIGRQPDEVPVVVPSSETEWGALRATPLLRHLRAITEWVRPGRTLTEEDIRSLPEYDWWIDHHELTIADRDHPEIAEFIALLRAWRVAMDADLVTVRDRRAIRGPRADLLDADPSAASVQVGRDAIELLIDQLMGPRVAPTLWARDLAIVPVLVSLCSPTGLDLASLPAEGGSDEREPGDVDDDHALAEVTAHVIDALCTLTTFGLLPAAHGHVAVPEVLRAAVVAAINASGAPLRIDLKPGAIPLPEPED